MIPTVEEICSKEIVTTTIDSSIETSIKRMAQANVRSIMVLDDSSKDFYILTADDAIEFKLQNISLKRKLKDVVLKRVQTIDAKVNLLELINHTEMISEYMIVLSNNKIAGILSQTDIINNIDPKILIERQSIGKLILQYSAITVYENEATVNTIKQMKQKHVDAVIILGSNDNPKGIFTTKDFLNILHKNSDLALPVKSYMTSPLLTVNEEAKISEVLDFIKEKHFKRVVVTNKEGSISGLITQSEILRVINNKWMEMIKERGNELSRLNEKLIERATNLEEKASKDYLTKLFNRRKFNTLIQYEISQLKRNKQRNLSLIIIDLDNFKYINDTYGHDTGDEILIDLARIFKLSCRDSDILCRWGGEEFALALPETTIDNGMLVAQKIRKSVESHIFAKDLQLTCSLGVAQFHSDDTYAEFFKRADEALYCAKNSGKNKVVLESI